MARELTGLVLKDKWHIDAFLGEGGVAAVYAATHRNGKRVAVKVLHPHLASIAEVRDRFLREGYLANRVDHPGAVGVLDDDMTDEGLVFFVMDLLDGESLEKRLAREGRLASADVLAITDGLLDVLAAAHAKGIVHRDIKPENIYLLRDGGLRLLDFGIARLHEQTAAKNATQSGAAMGTPSYMPPEQARGRWEMVDARSDLWSVGATMFALLTGRCVHEAETVNETLLLAMARPAAPLTTMWPQAPPSVATIVDRALAFEMNERWPDAQSMRAAVQHARQTLAAQPEVPSQTWAAPQATMGLHLTPSGPLGTVLASSVSERPPIPGSSLATARGRAAIGISLGAGLGAMALVVVLAVLGHKSSTQPGASGSSTLPPNGVPSATPLPSAVLAPQADPIPAAPSASVATEVSQAPAASATAVVNVPPRPAPYRPPPPVTVSPWGPPPPAAPKHPPAAPTSNPLDSEALGHPCAWSSFPPSSASPF